MQSSGEQSIHLKDYFAVILKRKWMILAFPAILVIVVTIGSFKLTPVYQASCQLLIEKEIPDAVTFEEAIGIDTVDQDYYQTQYKILESRSLSQKVVQKLELEHVEEFFKPRTNLYVLFQKSVLKKNVSLTPLDIEGVIDRFITIVEIQPIRNTRLIKINARSRDPRLAAAIANTLAESYIDQNLEDKLFASRQILKKLLPQAGGEGLPSNDADLAELILSLPSVVNHPLIQKLKEGCAVLESKYAGLSKRYGPKHPKIIGVKSALAEMKEKINLETKRVVSSVKTELSGSFKSNNIRIIDSAKVPNKAVYPNKRLNAILALISGLVLGCGLAFLFEYLDNTVKNQEDIEVFLGLHFLGHVPSVKYNSNKKKVELYTCVNNDPNSPTAEAFRNIRTWLFFSSYPSAPIKTLMVSSSGPQEGKSMVALNLAISMAQTGGRVLLVDADMRRPSVHHVLNLLNFRGLSNYLKKDQELKKVIQETYIENLYCICSGPLPPNPSELLGSIRMRKFIMEAEKEFDCIIFDSTPILNVADAVVLAKAVEGVIQVIHYGKYHKGMIYQARQRIQEMNIKIIGGVLNNVPHDKSSYSYYPYYSSEYYQRKEKALSVVN